MGANMKIVQINAVCGVGSTGKICVALSDLLSAQGIENYVFYSSQNSSNPNAVRCSNKLYTKYQAVKARLLGNYGFNSKAQTRKMIALMEQIRPDIVNLHNVHGHDCHLELLFDYFRRREIKVFWTFHDCWAFTGYCTHFTYEKCDKWKTGCRDCPQNKKYSLFFDRSEELYNRKKAAFSGVDLTVITPSQWLADLVRQSFLRDYPVEVIHNGIDLSIFRPTHSDFRERYNIPSEKHIVLGVASGWGIKKGLDVFIELSRRLDNEQYQIVLVGTDERVDGMLPDTVLSIHRTNNQQELAEIYTAADVFVNPTKEDTYPTVNLEAIACGTPVITFASGGSPEIVDHRIGIVIGSDDMEALTAAIKRVCTDQPFLPEDFLKRALDFDMNERFKEYVALYEKD